jgi:pimeloyl-ACP methyl ester carboxylesterase
MSAQTVQLPDGRTLAWREYGDPKGFPVVFTHGVFNSRLFQPVWDKTDQITSNAGARVIAVDRPGYGESTYYLARSYTQWASDVSFLTKSLLINRFAVLGYSSGGPSALACARELPEQVVACALCSSDCPYHMLDALGVEGGGEQGYLQKMFGAKGVTEEMARKNAEFAFQVLEESYSRMKKKDRAIVALADLHESVAQGIDKGCTQDGLLESSDWGIDIAGISIPVHLWHGESDEDVPIEAGKWLASQIPNCKATYVPGESHSMLRRKWGSLLNMLVGTATAKIARL